MDERLVRIERKVDALDQKIDTTAQRLDEKIERLDRKIEASVERLDHIEASVERLDHKIEASVERLDHKIAASVQRLDRKIEVTIESVKDGIRNVAEGLTALGERMDRGFEEMANQAMADRKMFLGIFANHEERISALEHRDSSA